MSKLVGPRGSFKPKLSGTAIRVRAQELAGKRMEAERYFLANPLATETEVARLLDVPRSTAGGWRIRLKRKQPGQATARGEKAMPTPFRVEVRIPESPASLKAEAIKLRDDLRELLRLAEAAIPACEILEALDGATATITNLKTRLANVIAQRDSVQKKLLERNMASPGD